MADRYKHILRKTYQSIRNHLPRYFQDHASQQICDRIKHLAVFQQANRIGLYYPFYGEPDIKLLWKLAHEQHKSCYFPILNKNMTLTFLPATPETLFKKNKYGILEPDLAPEDAISSDKMDIIFMPLVAFDGLGSRIGMGAGYYDRTLSENKHALLMGVAFEFQLEYCLFPEFWDVAKAATITPENTYWSPS